MAISNFKKEKLRRICLVSTKIEANHNKIYRTECLDELATVLFPGNKNHQKIFISIFVELKWAEDQFLSTLEPVADKYGYSRRVLEAVRAKMRRLGLIDHVSRFNKKYGYREGWVFSNRFSRALSNLGELIIHLRKKKNSLQEKKERDLFKYI
jgi:hypothetical protein